MRGNKYFFIIAFMLILMLPLVFVDFETDRISVEENRMLANRPPLFEIKKHPGKYIKGFDAWFVDSIGFREQLLALYRVIDKNSWLNNNVRYAHGQQVFLIGEQGHHYFADIDGALIPKFQGKQFITNTQLLTMEEKLEEVKMYLERENIPFIVMFCTDKETIYPEFYPRSIRRGPEPVQLDIITKYIEANTNVDIFNIRQSLLLEKDAYQLYYISTGDLSHYTQIGAFFAYRELMKHINKYFPAITPYELNDIEIVYNEREMIFVNLKLGTTYKELDSSFFNDVSVTRPFTSENVAFENKKSDLPVILLLGDSYASEPFIGKYLAQQFGKVILIHHRDMRYLEEYVTQFKPNIVVFETAERGLGGFANALWTLPYLSDEFILTGFYSENQRGERWINGDAKIVSRNHSATNFSLVGFYPAEWPDNKLSVVINMKETVTVDLIPGKVFTIDLNFQNETKSVNISLKTEKTFIPKNEGWGSDKRVLGVLVTSWSLSE